MPSIKYLCILLFLSACNTEPRGEDILEKSIAFHDPTGQWNKLQQKIMLKSNFVYPDSSFYDLEIGLDNSNQLVSYANTTIGSQVDFSGTDCWVIKGERTCEQTAWTKNFYHFILGLPMTLQYDCDLIEDEVEQTTFHDVPSQRITVNFEQEKWHFYFSKVDYHLVGYTFDKNFVSKAEEILTEGLIEVEGMKLSESRSWWITTDSLNAIYSGRDEIQSSSNWVQEN